MALPGRPSCASTPCACEAKRLRGVPKSITRTGRRVRASCKAADRPAKLPPITIKSNMVESFYRFSCNYCSFMCMLTQIICIKESPTARQSRQITAIDGQCCAIDEGRLRPRQKDHQAGDFTVLAHAAHGYHGAQKRFRGFIAD